MFPGFITLFKDDEAFIHLYFFKGLKDDGKSYYNDLDLSKCKYEFKKIDYDDGAIEYIFANKNIKSMKCNLVTYNGKTDNFILKI